jgi:hypothetical protein
VTVAVKVAVWGGQLSVVSFGNRVDAEGLTLTPTPGPLLVPQATRSPISMRDAQSATIMPYLDTLRPAKPAITMPASGSDSGSHGERLSALRRSFLTAPAVFGPVVLMVTVTGCGDVAPWAIELKEQLTVASGRPLQAKVMALVNVDPLFAVTLKVEVVDSPENTVAGVVGADKVKFWFTVSVTVVVADRLPEVPVIVTDTVPGVAVPVAVKVSVLVAAVGLGLNAAVTPADKPVAARVTFPVNPLTSVTVMVLVPEFVMPGARVTPPEFPSVKLGAAVTVSAIVVVAVRLPDVPVMVTVAVPWEAPAPAVRVSVLVAAVGFGTKAAVTPVGKPVAARVTLPVNPPASVTVMTLVLPGSVGVIVKLAGFAASEKPGPAATVSEIVVVAVVLPEVPVIVMVLVPVAAEPLAVSESVLVVAVDVGLNTAVTPLGKPEAARLTLPVNPPASVTVITLVPAAPPLVIDTEAGLAARVKPAVAVTTTTTELVEVVLA